MFVVDTNVLSEEMRLSPEPRVLAWLNAYPARDYFTTAITEAELLYGIAVLPDGRRKQELAAGVARVMGLFAGRILPFESAAAGQLAVILSNRKRVGKPMGSHDALIAAIARSRGMTVATRDIRDFADCGVPLVDPWVV